MKNVNKNRFGLTFVLLLVLALTHTPFLKAQIVMKDEARNIAEKFAKAKLSNNENKKINDEYVVNFNNEASYYVFNFIPSGFVIISADKSTNPILAYSYDESCYSDTKNPSFEWWMKKYSSEIADLRSQKANRNNEPLLLWDEYSKGNFPKSRASLSPLLNTKWDQTDFYNEFCPTDNTSTYDEKCVTGCVATAIGQLMNYFRFPKNGEGNYTSEDITYGTLTVDYAAAEYKFNEMATKLTRTNQETAELLYNIGVGVDMHYGPKGSGMTNHKGAIVMRDFFNYNIETEYIFRHEYTKNWDSTILAYLNQKIPLYYAGWGDNNYIMGHAFVVDGYDDANYFHFNWGWGGGNDGYFLTQNLNPAGNNFNLKQELIINMFPKDDYPYFCNGIDTITSLDGTIDDGSGPLFGYQNNIDCSWLIAPNDSVKRITLNFLKFDTELTNDVLTIYDGDNSSAHVLGSFSGNSLPNSISSTGNRMFLSFTTNGSDTASGFLISFSATTFDFCKNLVTLTENSGTIEDGSGKYNYRGNTNCRWRIFPESAMPITIHFNELELDQTDSLKFVDVSNNEVLGVFKGSTFPQSLRCESGKLLISFNTSPTANAQGFNLYYDANVAIENVENRNFEIFPNPSSDLINITPKNITSKYEVKVIDVMGKIIYSNRALGKSIIDVSNFANGVYVIQMNSENKINAIKFVKK